MEEKRIEAIRRKGKNEAHLYMSVKVILEDAFFGHQGNDLFDPEISPTHEFRIKKSATLKEFLNTVADNLKWPADRLRPWPLSHRTNQTLRPSLVELEDSERTMIEVAENHNPWQIFLELIHPDADLSSPLPTFDKETRWNRDFWDLLVNPNPVTRLLEQSKTGREQRLSGQVCY